MVPIVAGPRHRGRTTGAEDRLRGASGRRTPEPYPGADEPAALRPGDDDRDPAPAPARGPHRRTRGPRRAAFRRRPPGPPAVDGLTPRVGAPRRRAGGV